MKTFFSSTFMNPKLLKEVGIHYPIQLAYYKITNKEAEKQQKAKFGIYIVKTEYKKENVKVEKKNIQYVSNDEKKIEEILNLLKENEVTPIAIEDVISDVSKNDRNQEVTTCKL